MSRFTMLALLALAACAGDDGGPTSNLKSTEQVNNSCPATPAILTGTVAAGGTCTTAEQCAPTCCTCADATRYLAANCVDGECATTSEACSNTADACE